METIIEVGGEVTDTSIRDTVELHCTVLLYGMITTHSELLDSPVHKWIVKHIHYNKQEDVTVLHLKDVVW